MNLTISVRVST